MVKAGLPEGSKAGIRIETPFTAMPRPARMPAILPGGEGAAIRGRKRPGRSPGLTRDGQPKAIMTKNEAKVRRTLHFKFTLPGASEQMIAMMKSSAPLYQMFGEAKVRLLQNVDDPSRFLQQVEYDAPERMELNRQQIASDPRVQAYLQAWRAMFPGAIEIDVYEEM
jgi:hypothetical protein